ncbi:MAG: hypothetical protein WCO09_04905, partial [bacterium]
MRHLYRWEYCLCKKFVESVTSLWTDLSIAGTVECRDLGSDLVGTESTVGYLVESAKSEGSGSKVFGCVEDILKVGDVDIGLIYREELGEAESRRDCGDSEKLSGLCAGCRFWCSNGRWY